MMKRKSRRKETMGEEKERRREGTGQTRSME
jgi:hypothetical protein